MVLKVIVTGAVNGNLSAVFSKLALLHVKQSFAFAIITGDLFADPTAATAETHLEVTKLLSGSLEVPFTTYFSLGRRQLPPKVVERLAANDGELAPNLYILGRRTSIKTAEGVQIVAIGGAHETQPSAETLDDYTPAYAHADIEHLKAAPAADVLLSSEWPADVRIGSKIPYGGEESPAHQDVTELCASLKPRYHFSNSATWYEREPFFHFPDDDADGYRITRFISLAPYGNAAKSKWIYAFSLTPNHPLPTSVPPGVTASPVSRSRKRKPDSSHPQPFSRYSTTTTNNNTNGSTRNPKRRRPDPTQCFFCLGNPTVATHMLASIGTHTYLATAKGPLPIPAQLHPHLAFPAHILLIPLTHAPSLHAVADATERAATLAEAERYRAALQQMLFTLSASTGLGRLGAVTWEISRAAGVHHHWQFMPLPEDVASGLVLAAFEVEAENLSYPRFLRDADEQEAALGGDFVRVVAGTEGLERTLVMPIDDSFRFDLQFPRRVLAKLLRLEARTQWRDCEQSVEEETADAEAFKKAFRPFDFSLEGVEE